MAMRAERRTRAGHRSGRRRAARVREWRQGRTWQREDDRYLFIENAVGWVDWLGREVVGQLDVQVAFGHPYFDSNVATMAVDFFISETDPNGTRLREVHRPFQIHADGRRESLF